MTLSDQLKNVVNCLKKNKIRFALTGGLVASLYRKQERLTKDLDFLFFLEKSCEKTAEKVLNELELIPLPIRMAEMLGGPLHAIKNKSTPIWMFSGVAPENSGKIQVDFLLPGLPWFKTALERAEYNIVDFGFGGLPCLTVEDIILSKFFSFYNRSTRFKDLDDLQEIFESNPTLDLNYLCDKIIAWELKVPDVLKKSVPRVLIKATK